MQHSNEIPRPVYGLFGWSIILIVYGCLGWFGWFAVTRAITSCESSVWKNCIGWSASSVVLALLLITFSFVIYLIYFLIREDDPDGEYYDRHYAH